MKQYLYIENNQVVVNPKEKPNQGAHHLAYRHGIYKALSEWRRNCKPIENMLPKEIFNGTPCETTETEPYRVTKIY